MPEQRGVPTPGSVRTCNSGLLASVLCCVQNSDIGGSQPIKYSSQVWCKLTFWKGRIQVDGLCRGEGGHGRGSPVRPYRGAVGGGGWGRWTPGAEVGGGGDHVRRTPAALFGTTTETALGRRCIPLCIRIPGSTSISCI